MSVEGLMLDLGMDVDMDAVQRREVDMFGMTVNDIREQYLESLTAKFSGLEMVVMGIMSDCQEMMAMKNPTIPSPSTDEYVRRQMNIAKYILTEIMSRK